MPDLWSVWSMGPTAAALALRAQGFTLPEANRLVVLRRRYERGEFFEVTSAQKRLEFARWLVQHGRLTDRVETVETAAVDESLRATLPSTGAGSLGAGWYRESALGPQRP